MKRLWIWMQQRELTNLEIKEDGGNDRFRRDLRVRRAAAIFCSGERFCLFSALLRYFWVLVFLLLIFFPFVWIARNRGWVSKGIVNGCFEEEIHNLHRGSTEFGAGMMSHSGCSAPQSRFREWRERNSSLGPTWWKSEPFIEIAWLKWDFHLILFESCYCHIPTCSFHTPFLYTYMIVSRHVLLFPFCPKRTQPKPFPSLCTALPPANDLNSPCNELLHWRADYLLYRWLP